MKLSGILRFLVLAVLSQNYVAYQSTPVSLDEAVGKGHVKLVSESMVYKFDSIQLKDGRYYGVGNAYGGLAYTKTTEGIKSALDSAKFKSVYLKDAKKSKKQNIWLGIAIAALVLFFGFGLLALSNMGI